MASNRISVAPAQRLVLTTSVDKTARLWSLGDGRMIGVLRPPIGAENEGKLYAGALSPDGSIAAVAGWTCREWSNSFCIYLFDTSSQKLIRRISNLPNSIESLTFSPDGRFLATGLDGGNGLVVWRTADWTAAWSDAGYKDSVYGLAFSSSDGLISSSFDGYLRSYDPTGKLKWKVKAPGGTNPFGLAVSPDGKQLAVGYLSNLRVDVLSVPELRLLLSPDLTGANGPMASVAWSADGSLLFAGGQAQDQIALRLIRVWSDRGRGSYRDCPVSDNTILGLTPLSEQDVGFASGDPSWGVLTASCRVGLLFKSGIGDFRGAGDSFRVSPDAKTVRFGFQPSGELPATFSLTERSLTYAPPESAGLVAPVTSRVGMELAGWLNSSAPKLNGKSLALSPFETALSSAISGERLLLGTQWNLRLFNKDGELLWATPAPGAAWAVNATPDGRLAVAAFGDGSIRWYRLSDGAELLALFSRDDRRWVAWTPKGYYEASVNGDDLIGWHVNRGKDHEADFFPAKQFSDQFNRPDVVARVLDMLDDDEAVREANAVAGRKAAAPDVALLLPPVLKILSPTDVSSVTTSPVQVTYLVQSPTPVIGISVSVDGRPVTTAAPQELTSGSGGTVATISVPMPQHDAVISLVAANAQSKSQEVMVHLSWHGPKEWYKPDLYVLAVGVAKYNDVSLALKYPAKDAEDFAAAIRAEEGGLYKHVEVRVLSDEHATREDIRRGLSWLSKTSVRDVAMVFLSGHGLNDARQHYHFLPHDTDLSDLDLTTVQDFEIRDFLSKVPGKVFMFLDTCYTSNLPGRRGPTQPDIDALATQLARAENGIVVFTASSGQQFCLESDKWQNGAFTKALVEALKGGADYQHDKRITIGELDVYLSHRVRELTNGEQSPAAVKPATIADLTIATVAP